ncbi:wall-associated receptor kinase-like protein 8 [Tanacetum coccineum]
MKLFRAYFFLVLEILFSLTTTSVAVPKYAKTGCDDTCGNVRIPFPFGIGANCSLNEWYNVDCNSSTPYLSSLINTLQVLGVDLENRTVTVKMQKLSNCSQTTKSVDLGSSPFLYSINYNTFVYEGYCGNAIMMDNHGSVLAGCSTPCINDTVVQHESYLVDKNAYQSGTSYIPTSLEWFLSYHDREQVSCATMWYNEETDLGNGTLMDSWSCNGDDEIQGNPYLIDGYVVTASLKYAKPGCKDTCGNNVVIPYPFGIGASCSVNEWYTVYCNSSKPYLAALNDQLQLLGVDLENQTVTVNMPKFSDCGQPIKSMDLGSSPFVYSKTHNKLIYEGYCGSVLTGCSTTCNNDNTTTSVIIDTNKCFGISCCQTTIPRYLKSYRMNLKGLESQSGRDGGCGSAFLVHQDLYDDGRFSLESFAEESRSSYGSTALLWTLSGGDKDQFTCCDSYGEWNKPMSSYKVDLGNGTSLDTWRCDYDEVIGNPYLVDGCRGTPSMVPTDYEPTEECTRCQNSGGYCENHTVYDVDGLVYQNDFICFRDDYKWTERKTTLGVILGVSISMGLLFLAVITYILYKVIKKTKELRRRKKFFKRNGGLLLKQQEEADPSLVDQTILFTSRQLEKATDNFNENRVLGRGGQGTVYKGMLVDGRIVAVKKSKIVDESKLEEFINEVVILSQVNHRNVVKLLGCCLETDVPLLVSEFIPNGTLYDRIHCETDEDPMSLNMRLPNMLTEMQA